MNLSGEKRANMPARGLWCNLCGARLAGDTTEPRENGHKTSRVEASARLPLWSLCMQCYADKLKCAACFGTVAGSAFMLEGERGIYCRSCFEGRPRCDTCGRPVGVHYWTSTGGRKLCDRCQSTAVSDDTHAHALFRRVRAALSLSLNIALREPCQLKIVSRRQLCEMIDKSTLHSLDAGSRGRCFGLFIQEGRHRAIFIEYGLPQIVLIEVMAHEFAHAWQSENCSPEVPVQLQEGFAEWVAYKLLQSWGCKRRAERMLRREDLYGRGLRIMLEWERQDGESGVIRRLGQARSSEHSVDRAPFAVMLANG